MRDWMLWLPGAIIVVMIIGLIISIPFAIHYDNQFRAACHAKGGKILSTRSRDYCVKPDTLIDVNTN